MAIVNTLSKSEFRNEMYDSGFSYEALGYMYDYYDEMSGCMEDGNIEFDPIVFRSEWDEFDDICKLYDAYEMVIDIDTDDFMIEDEDGNMNWDPDKEDELIDAVLESLQMHTTAVALEGGHFLVLSSF